MGQVMNEGKAQSQEVGAVMSQIIELAKELGLLARSVSREALDIELRGIVFRVTDAPPAMVNKCRLATDELTHLVTNANYLAETTESLKDKLYSIGGK